MPDRSGLLPKFNVLIIENDPAAARLTHEAFKEAGVNSGIEAVPDGEHALAYLRRQNQWIARPDPDIIFLDLHLPRTSGLEVLREIKADPRLLLTPVVVVSGSENPQEVRESYELHANCFVRKPDDLHSFLKFVETCYLFWGTFVTLPSHAVQKSAYPVTAS